MKDLLENLQGYIQSNIDLAKLEVQEKIENYLSKVVKLAGLVVFAMLSIIFLFIFLGLLIGSILNSYVVGFGIIFLLLAITTIITYIYQKQNTNNKAGIN